MASFLKKAIVLRVCLGCCKQIKVGLYATGFEKKYPLVSPRSSGHCLVDYILVQVREFAVKDFPDPFDIGFLYHIGVFDRICEFQGPVFKGSEGAFFGFAGIYQGSSFKEGYDKLLDCFSGDLSA